MRRIDPFELLYANMLQWCGWNSADVITSGEKQMKCYVEAKNKNDNESDSINNMLNRREDTRGHNYQEYPDLPQNGYSTSLLTFNPPPLKKKKEIICHIPLEGVSMYLIIPNASDDHKCFHFN